MELFSKQPGRLGHAPSATPPASTDKDFRGTLKSKHNIHIAGGQGTMEGKIFRVNHMGYTDTYDCLAVVAAIEHALKTTGQAGRVRHRRRRRPEGAGGVVLI